MHKGEGSITILRRRTFCLIFLKNFVTDPSLYDKISGNGRFFACGGNHHYQSEGGVNTISCRFFMSHSTETFVGEPFSVSLFSGIEKF